MNFYFLFFVRVSKAAQDGRHPERRYGRWGVGRIHADVVLAALHAVLGAAAFFLRSLLFPSTWWWLLFSTGVFALAVAAVERGGMCERCKGAWYSGWEWA